MNHWLKKEKDFFTLSVYIVPRSSRSEITGVYNGALKIKLKSPPVDNAANEELVKFLSAKLKVPKSNIEMVSGYKQKRKTLRLNIKDLDTSAFL